jgi:hypothetical protein
MNMETCCVLALWIILFGLAFGVSEHEEYL